MRIAAPFSCRSSTGSESVRVPASDRPDRLRRPRRQDRGCRAGAQAQHRRQLPRLAGRALALIEGRQGGLLLVRVRLQSDTAVRLLRPRHAHRRVRPKSDTGRRGRHPQCQAEARHVPRASTDRIGFWIDDSSGRSGGTSMASGTLSDVGCVTRGPAISSCSRHLEPRAAVLRSGEALGGGAELEQLGLDALWLPDIGGPVLEAVDRASYRHFARDGGRRGSSTSGCTSLPRWQPRRRVSRTSIPGGSCSAPGSVLPRSSTPRPRAVRTTAVRHARVSRRARRGAAGRAGSRECSPHWRPDAGARGRARRRNPSIPRSGRAHVAARRALGAGAHRARAQRDHRARCRRGLAGWRGSTSRCTSACPTTRTSGGVSGTATTISRRAEVTAWSMLSMPTGPSRRSPSIAEYQLAGADHVCLRVVAAGPERLLLPEWRCWPRLRRPHRQNQRPRSSFVSDQEPYMIRP